MVTIYLQVLTKCKSTILVINLNCTHCNQHNILKIIKTNIHTVYIRTGCLMNINSDLDSSKKVRSLTGNVTEE